MKQDIPARRIRALPALCPYSHSGSYGTASETTSVGDTDTGIPERELYILVYGQAGGMSWCVDRRLEEVVYGRVR